MTTAPKLKSSRDRSTIRPVGVPPSSKTRNALNDFISYQLPLEGPGFDFRRALEILEIEAVHAVDDSRVGARGGFEPGPRHGLRRLAIGVEVHVEVAGVDARHESEEPAEIAGRRRLLGSGVRRPAEFAERADRQLLRLRSCWSACVPQLGGVRIAPTNPLAVEI